MPQAKNNGRPNLAIRTAQILANVAKDEASSYVSELTDLVNEAKELNSTLSKGMTTGKEIFQDFRKNGMKKFVDWFYSGADQFAEDDFDNDDDSDFSTSIDTSSGEESEEPKSKALDDDGMKHIAKGQINALYKITGKQVEANIMSTAEIISTIKEGNSYIIKSLETTNSTLSSIDKKLDAMLKLQSAGLEHQSELTEDGGGLLNDEGKITLKTLTKSITDAFNNSWLGIGIETVRDQSDNLTPERLISTVLEMTGIKDKQFKLLGGQSINEIGESINRTIGNAISGSFEKLLDSKLADFIEEKTNGINLKYGSRQTDYSAYVKNNYNKEKASFDNITRQSIVHIIPEYLKIIAGSLTGVTYNVTPNGKLTSGSQINQFDKEIENTTRSFGTGISNKHVNEKFETHAKAISPDISRGELGAIGQMVVAACVDYMEEKGIQILTKGDFGNDVKRGIRERVTRAIQDTAGGDISYWNDLVGAYFTAIGSDPLSMQEFLNQVGKAYVQQDKRLKSYAQSTERDEELRSIREGERLSIIAKSAFGDGLSDLERQQQELEEEIENLVKNKKRGNDVKRKQQELERITRQIENQNNRGDTEESKQSVIDNAYTSRLGGGTGSTAYQTDVTKTLHEILDILRKGFAGPLIPGHNAPGPKKPKQKPIKIRKISSSKKSIPVIQDEEETTDDDDDEDTIEPEEDDGIGPIPPTPSPKSFIINPNRRVKYTIKPQARSFKRTSSNIYDIPSLENAERHIITDQGTGMGDDIKQSSIKTDEIRKTPEQEPEATNDTNGLTDDSEEIKALLQFLILNQDGIQRSDTPIFGQIMSGVKNSAFANRTRNFFNKLTKREDDKKEETKEDEKKSEGGLFGSLFGGVKKLFAPLTSLLTPLTTMLVGPNGLFNKMFGKDIQGIKEGFNQIKEGATETLDQATKGKFSKTVDKFKEFTGSTNPEETGIGETSSSQEEDVDKITEQLKEDDDNADQRHKQLISIITDIYNKIKGNDKPSSSTNSQPDTKTKSTNPETGIGDISSTKSTEQTETTQETDIQPQTEKSSETQSTSEATKGGEKTVGGKLSGIKKILGGISKVAGNIFTIIAKVLLSLSAVKSLINMATRIITKAIKPLNKAVRALTKMIKPLLNQLAGIIKKVAQVIVGLINGLSSFLMPVLNIISKTLSGLMKIIEPVLDVLVKFVGKISDILGKFFDVIEGVFDKLEPIFDMIGSALSQILETITGLVTDILEPLMNMYGMYISTLLTVVMDVITPVLKVVTSVLVPAVKIIAGVIQVGFGIVQVGIGKLLDGIGKVINKLDPLDMVNVDDSIMDSGQSMVESGKELIQKGVTSFGDVIGNIGKTLGITDAGGFGSEMKSLFKEMKKDFDEIFKSLSEAFNEIFEPIRDIVRDIVNEFKEYAYDIIIPFFAEIKSDVIPAIQILTGIVSVGFGGVLVGIGNLLQASSVIGNIISALGNKFGTVLKVVGLVGKDAGQPMITAGTHIAQSGIKNIKAGYSALFSNVESEISSSKINASVTVNEQERTPTTGFSMDGTVVSDTYGSGDQASYGNYLNMKNRGCGPIALADAASRRTGGNVDARSLAGAMYSSGNYSTSRGTSVSGFVNTAGSMGLGYKVGGVTANSLRAASPTNPITIVGSGNGYDTKRGNTHYVNVIGTKNGIAYTSNPLTGRVERRSVGDITAGALMGLYGSGDISMSDAFTEGISDLFSDLSELASGLLDIFNFDDAGSLAKKQEEETYKKQYTSIKNRVGADKLKEYESGAFKEWAANNPRRQGESASSYLSRWNKVSTKQTVEFANKTIAEEESKRYDTFGDAIADSATALAGVYDPKTGKWFGGATDTIDKILTAIGLDSMSSSYGATGGGTSGGISGGVLGVIPTVIKAYEAAGVVGKSGDYNQWGRTHKLNINGQEYVERPDCTGLCDTVIDVMGYNSEKMNSASFNSAKGIKDKSGNISPDWEFHNNPALSDFQPGDIGIIYQGGNHHGEIYAATENGRMYGYNYGDDGPIAKCLKAVNLMQSDGLDVATAAVKAGSGINGHHKYTRLIRYVGAGSSNTPTSSYDLNNAAAAGVSSTQGKIDMSNLSPYYSNTWNYYKDKSGIREYFAAAQKAGMSPAQQALIMGMGIWEDNAKKLTGQKDLTKVTYDKNGQAAFGLMNWIPKHNVGGHDTSYGTTLADQLNYISKAYFGSSPERSQGRINNNVNQYGNALAKLAGHAVTGKVGDAIGPIIDRDLIEGGGHYVGVALVPEGWDTPKGLGKYIGTMVDAYNWMVDNGLATGQAGTSYVGGIGNGSIFGTIGSRVQSLLSDGDLNSSGDETLGSAISSAIKNGTLKLMDTATLAKDTLFEAADATKSIVNTAIADSNSNKTSVISGLKEMIGNRITTAGKVVSDWWNNVKQITASTEPNAEGILTTFKDIGASLYDTGTGIVGSIIDDFGQEAQLVWNGVTKELSIIKGTAESVAEQIANGVKSVAESIITTTTYGVSKAGSKLDDLLSGNYGVKTSINPNSGSLFQAINSQLAIEMGYDPNATTSSYADGSYDDVSDEELDALTSTIVPVADNGDMWSGYNSSVNSRMQALWKNQIDNGLKLWSQVTRYNKDPEKWYNTYLSTNGDGRTQNKNIADYFIQLYPSKNTQAFKNWYYSKFKISLDASTAQMNAARQNRQTQAAKTLNTNLNDLRNTGKQMILNGALIDLDRSGTKNTTTVTDQLITSGTYWAGKATGIDTGINLYGKGDEPTSEIVIPPINEVAIQQQLGDMMQQEETQSPTIVNQYLVGQNTSDNTDWIDRLNNITFNVRAERVEELLEKINEKLDTIDTSNNATVVSTPQQPTGEEARIPDQVTRLARG